MTLPYFYVNLFYRSLLEPKPYLCYLLSLNFFFTAPHTLHFLFIRSNCTFSLMHRTVCPPTRYSTPTARKTLYIDFRSFLFRPHTNPTAIPLKSASSVDFPIFLSNPLPSNTATLENSLDYLYTGVFTNASSNPTVALKLVSPFSAS